MSSRGCHVFAAGRLMPRPLIQNGGLGSGVSAYSLLMTASQQALLYSGVADVRKAGWDTGLPGGEGGRSDRTMSLQIVAKFRVRPKPGGRELVTCVRRRKKTPRAVPRVRSSESRVMAVASSTLPALTNPRSSEWANSALADDPRLLLSRWVAISTRIEEGPVPQWRNCLSNAKAGKVRTVRDAALSSRGLGISIQTTAEASKLGVLSDAPL
ncbi:hypothetical protein R1flu_018159 [Riccia fluitans]|uniref:Uncharacterized protein n=1 Tax=Riccia fluitans TaxID=41844 RepID=A0ABD1ZHB2_9MARC